MKIYFNIEVGMFNRSSVRTQLQNSKSKLEFWYPNCRVILTEDKSFFESSFYFEANNLPESAKNHMETWLKSIRNISDN